MDSDADSDADSDGGSDDGSGCPGAASRCDADPGESASAGAAVRGLLPASGVVWSGSGSGCRAGSGRAAGAGRGTDVREMSS